MPDPGKASRADEQNDRTKRGGPPTLSSDRRSFEELTLLELAAHILAAPRGTWRKLRQASRRRLQTQVALAPIAIDKESAAPTGTARVPVAWKMPTRLSLTRERRSWPYMPPPCSSRCPVRAFCSAGAIKTALGKMLSAMARPFFGWHSSFGWLRS